MTKGKVAAVGLGLVMSSAHGPTLSPFPLSGLLSPLSNYWASSLHCDSHPLIPWKWTSNSNASWINSFRRCQSRSFQGPSPLQVGKLRVREGLKGLQTADGRSRTWVPQASVFLKQIAHKTPGDWHSGVYFFILTALISWVCPPWTWIHWHECTLKV